MIFDKRALNSHTALNLGAIFRQAISNLQAISSAWLLALANERERERERESKSPHTSHKTTFSTQNLNFKARNAKFTQNSNFAPQNAKFKQNSNFTHSENGQNSQNTHPQTPSAREGAFKVAPTLAQQGAFQGANFIPQNTKLTPQSLQSILQGFEFRSNFKEIHANHALQAFCLSAKALR